MRQVNLLPSELRTREVTQRTVPFALLAVGIGIAAVIIPWLNLAGVKTNLDAEVASRQLAIGLILPPEKATASQTQNAAVTDITSRIQVLNTLASVQLNWPAVFSEVQNSLPKDVVLTSYHVANATMTTTLNMTGTAPSNLSFASFIDSLKSDTHYSLISVDGFTYNASDGSVKFSITATMKATDIQFSPPK